MNQQYLQAAALLTKDDLAILQDELAVRKAGKLPPETIGESYDLEYGTDTIEIQADAVAPGQRVVVMDDLLATGGTMAASVNLLRQVGADVRGAACIIELNFLKGRERLDVPVTTLIQYDE